MNTGQHEQPQTATSNTGSNTSATSEQAPHTELSESLKRYVEIGECAAAWGGSIAKISALETKRSLVAAKQVMILRLVQLPVLLTLYVSLCIASYIAVVTATSNPYLGLLACLGLQIFIFLGLQFGAKSAGKKVGFDATKKQVKEAWHDINQKD